jgi:ubiquinone/menaquinone biosynthesis C-methylase UbiE
MLKSTYNKLHRLASNPKERDEYSAGFWQDKIRKEALSLCAGMQGRVLEGGCGEGLFLNHLAVLNPGLQIWGVDNDLNRLHRAKERAKGQNFNNIKLSRQDAANLTFTSGYFDAVLCINTFLNLRSVDLVKQVLFQMRRVGKGGAKIIFDFRNSANPLLRLKYGLARYYDASVKDLPLNTYSPKVINNILSELKLEIIKRKPIGLNAAWLSPVIVIEAVKSVV